MRQEEGQCLLDGRRGVRVFTSRHQALREGGREGGREGRREGGEERWVVGSKKKHKGRGRGADELRREGRDGREGGREGKREG
jgi:hypothetical protein